MGRDKRIGEQTEMNQQSVKRERQTTGLPEEQMDNIGLTWTQMVTGAAFAGLLLFTGVFFMSDIGDRIIQSKYNQHVAAASSGVVSKPSDSSNTFHIALFTGDKMSKEDVIQYLESLSDADFEKFKQAILAKGAALESSDDGAVKALLDALASGDVTSKVEVIEYLKGMSDEDFNAFIRAVATIVEPQPTDSTSDTGPLNQTLADAYAEAEARYPGQIDGSKRLKLIADLNAGPYQYYVAEQGDTLIKLSQVFGVSLGQLVELNGIHDADVIAAGEILLFPSNAVQPEIKDAQ